VAKTMQTENATVNNGALQNTITVLPAVTKGIYIVRITSNDRVFRTELVYEK